MGGGRWRLKEEKSQLMDGLSEPVGARTFGLDRIGKGMMRHAEALRGPLSLFEGTHVERGRDLQEVLVVVVVKK